MRVFISYHTPDDAKARAVEAALTLSRPGTECYLAPRSNIAGAYWLPRLADEIATCDAVLFLAGARIGPWQELEYYEALRLSRGATGRPRLVPVVMASQAPGLPFFAQLHQIFAAEPAAPEHLSAIALALEESVPADENRWEHFQPYKGLPALQEADAAFFFGRESETADILNLLAARPDRIIALLGQSGVGKSSLARAGVVARLKSQMWPLPDGAWPASLKDSRAFLPLVVRPGDQPLKELALAFAQLYGRTPAEINEEADSWARQFAGGTRLRDMLRAARDRIGEALGAAPPSRFILYIDQGEELYAEGNAGTAPRFSRLLAEAAEHEAFSVLLSLRSDYYTPYQNDRDLFLASERIDILALASEVLTDIVRKPAETLGARFESTDMAGRVVEATRREPGALPLLSDLMHDMWLTMQARGDGVLRWSDNPEIVDVAAPLRTRAEGFLAEHAGDEAVVRRLFTLHLSQVPKSGEPVRRRARRGECDPVEWRVAEMLADERWRLLTLGGAADAEPVVEVAHEQLLRRWPRLSDWLTEEREFLVWRGQVEEDAAEADADLLTGRRLAVARLWFERRAADLPPSLRDYIAASIAADDRRLAAERRRRRTIFTATAVGLVVALALAGLAGWQWRVAEAQRARAQQTLDLATQTANALVFDLAQKFRDAGVPASIIEDILDRARKLQDQLAAGGANSPALRRSQAAALDETAEELLTIGDTKGALAAATQARDIFQALAASAPDNTGYQRELAVSDEWIGEVLRQQGDLAGALSAYRDSLTIRQALTQRDPSNTLWQGDLSVSDEKIGDMLMAQGDLAGSMTSYNESLAIRKGLTQGNPANTEWQLDLSVSDIKVGEVLQAQGNLAGALSAYRDSLTIRKALAVEDPSNTNWQRELAVCDERIAEVLREQGDLAGALVQYRAELSIMEPVAKRDPSNANWQEFISIVYLNVGEVLQAQGDLVGALASFRDDLAIARALAEKDPTNAERQSNLALALYSVATAGDDVTANLTEALAILQRLDTDGKLTADQKGWIPKIQEALAKAP